jgi:hypothetical protein
VKDGRHRREERKRKDDPELLVARLMPDDPGGGQQSAAHEAARGEGGQMGAGVIEPLDGAVPADDGWPTLGIGDDPEALGEGDQAELLECAPLLGRAARVVVFARARTTTTGGPSDTVGKRRARDDLARERRFRQNMRGQRTLLCAPESG